MIVQKWHAWLDQPTYDEAWYKSDIAGELAELREAKGLIHRWSEYCDVVYSVTVARYHGYEEPYPIHRAAILLGAVYMYPKYTSRAVFYRRAGQKAGIEKLRSVKNPRKDHKLISIAEAAHIDPEVFVSICHQQRKYWPLLP